MFEGENSSLLLLLCVFVRALLPGDVGMCLLELKDTLFKLFFIFGEDKVLLLLLLLLLFDVVVCFIILL